MRNIIKLTVHKNTLQKRKDKQLRNDAVKYFKKCINQKDISGYAIAVWDKNAKTTSCSHVEDDSPIGRAVLPEHLKVIFLDRFINS